MLYFEYKEVGYMKNTEWKDKNNNIRCESCGKTIADNKIFREHGLGYCKKCYDDIQKYNSGKRKS